MTVGVTVATHSLAVEGITIVHRCWATDFTTILYSYPDVHTEYGSYDAPHSIHPRFHGMSMSWRNKSASQQLLLPDITPEAFSNYTRCP
jgi:hypothetical protein